MNNPAFNENPITEVIIEKKHSFFNGLRNIIHQGDILTDRIWKEKGKEWKQGNQIFEGDISNRNYFVNEGLIKDDNYPVLYQERTAELKTLKGGEGYEATEAELSYHRELFDNCIEKEIINWWEGGMGNLVIARYGKIDLAPEICQFARQCRNACGHLGVNITTTKGPDPIWKGVNLKSHQGKKLREILTEADFIDFWIDFERTELGVQFNTRVIRK